MSDYYAPCVVVPSIPLEHIGETELELMSAIFESEISEDNATIYFYSDCGRSSYVDGSFASAIEQFGLKEPTIESFSDSSSVLVDDEVIIALFRSIIKNVPDLEQMTLTSSRMCSKMIPDGFGGRRLDVRADSYHLIDTHDDPNPSMFRPISDLHPE